MLKVRRPVVETEIPSVSMADIAFLLLIFFISTTVLGVEEGLTLFLPPKSTADRRLVSREDVLVLRTDESDQVFADEVPVPDLNGLSTLVAERLRINPEIVVAIENHPRSRYKTMIQVLDEVKEAQATRISIRALPPEAGDGAPRGSSAAPEAGQ
jgi:biopolymer transport protein ExbD